jgi:ABC-type microcin C transport system permease subunit YejE
MAKVFFHVLPLLLISTTTILPFFVLAAEVTGTLSTEINTNTPVDYRPASAGLVFSVIDPTKENNSILKWELPILIKVILISGLILEIIVLLFIYTIQRARKSQTI